MRGDHALGDQAGTVADVGTLARPQPANGGRVAAFGSGQDHDIALERRAVGEEDGGCRHLPPGISAR